MAWIEIHQSLPTHRKIVSAGILADVPRMSIVGHLICLWTWALDNAPDGDLTNLSHEVIALGAQWTGDPNRFVEVLTLVGLLDFTNEILVIHDWTEYAGRLIERRKADRERKRTLRLSAGIPKDVRRNSAATVPYRTVPFTYIHILREIPGWRTKGEPHLDSLLKWAERKKLSEDILEMSAIGLAKTATSTLLKYDNLVRAFQDRINKGYDQPSQGVRRSQHGAHRRRDQSGVDAAQSKPGKFAGIGTVIYTGVPE